MLLCEAAGFDLVIVETVGVGQSEVAVADLVDLFLLVASPAGGDELQGIKRGIMELADLIVVNKADGDLAAAAGRAASDLRHAVHLLRPKRPGWEVAVLTCSALTGAGIAELWDGDRGAPTTGSGGRRSPSCGRARTWRGCGARSPTRSSTACAPTRRSAARSPSSSRPWPAGELRRRRRPAAPRRLPRATDAVRR